MRKLRYKIQIRPETDGTYTVTVPSLPGCLTYGDSIEEALEMAKEAIEVYIESLAARCKELPLPECKKDQGRHPLRRSFLPGRSCKLSL
ncbi:MAG: type II toxin-antitoxin system HicB family antitoxin [Methanothrix sp.]|nr:type II toxin-antitoxin system HicB family antitoxin [Methanothrix sp.]